MAATTNAFPLLSPTKGSNTWRKAATINHALFLCLARTLFSFFFFSFFPLTFYNCIVPMGFLPWEIRVALPRERQLRQIRATQPMVHAGCFECFHNPPNSDMDYRIFNVSTNVSAFDCTRGVRTHVRDSALKVDSGRKISCRTGESNMRQRRDGPML